MAIVSYSRNGIHLFRVYVQARGKNDFSLRVQRSKQGIMTLQEARKEEKKLLVSVVEEVAKIEGRGLSWSDIIHRWEIKARSGQLGDKYADDKVISLHVSRLHRYTKHWLTRRASDLNKGDGRQMLFQAKEDGAKESLLCQIKTSINIVYNWAIEERLILGATSTPVEGLNISSKVEKVPKILTLEEVRLLLREAKEREHEWYSIWAFAVLTGMRSGELMALQWSDIDLQKKIITVSKSYKASQKLLKSTKAGYWRTVPISTDLAEVILTLQRQQNVTSQDFVLPHLYAWKNGQAGLVLKEFLKCIGINKDIVFHTLRACFATHLLASGVDQAKVMKIGGWCDIKTFQIYVRLAGIDVRGATDSLDVMPRFTQDNVVSISQFSEG